MISPLGKTGLEGSSVKARRSTRYRFKTRCSNKTSSLYTLLKATKSIMQWKEMKESRAVATVQFYDIHYHKRDILTQELSY